MQIKETLNAGLKREIKVVVPKSDMESRLVSRLNDARGKADLVIATTEPGSISQRTFERLGFQVIYTRAILVKY